jgi:hypothetical protein
MSQHQSVSIPESQNLPTTPFSAPWLLALKRGIGTCNGQPMLPAGVSLTADQHRQIWAMIDQYRSRLEPQPGNHRLVAVVLAKLLAAFPAQGQSDVPAEQRMDAYFEALHGVPAWAADEARKAIITGSVPDLSGIWAPTPPQFAKVARAMLEGSRRTLAELERIAAAKAYEDIDQGVRERVSDGWGKLRADLIADRLKPADYPELSPPTGA